MSERHAPFWIYGPRSVKLTFEPSDPRPRITVHGGRKRGWHLVTVDVPYLVHVPGQKNRVGAKLVSVTSP